MNIQIKNWIIFWISALSTMIVWWLSYAAVSNTVTSWTQLTSSMWNEMAWNYEYSSNEVNTGKKWIDWKTIYRKVFTHTISWNFDANTDILSTDLSFIDKVTSVETILYDTSINRYYFFSDKWHWHEWVQVDLTNNRLIYLHWAYQWKANTYYNGDTLYTTVEYTK